MNDNVDIPPVHESHSLMIYTPLRTISNYKMKCSKLK